MKKFMFDTAILGATVIDGTGSPGYVADIGIVGERITVIGKIDPVQARLVVEARNLALAPGFIDAHAHDDAALLSPSALDCKISQGVTTVIIGNCGVSLAPLVLQSGQSPAPPLDAVGDASHFRFDTFGAYLDAVRAVPQQVNVAALVGHTTLRAHVMDNLSAPASENELLMMEALLDSSLAAGAIGLSSGLFYPPACAAPTSEVARLASRLASFGALYTAHIRDEADNIVEAIEEACAIARQGGVDLIISHHKLTGKANWGRSRETLPLLIKAGTAQTVGFDVYPYAAASTMLNPVSWAAAERTMITWCERYPQYAGWNLSDVAEALGVSENVAIGKLTPAGAIYFMMDEQDVERILCCGEAMIGTDGTPLDTHPHPRLWGSFTRVLGHYVRDRGVIKLEDAIRRMTSLAARRFGLIDRGVIAAGAYADLVLFDPDTVADAATFENPKQPSTGIFGVWVNGAFSWDGKTSIHPGAGIVLGRHAR